MNKTYSVVDAQGNTLWTGSNKSRAARQAIKHKGYIKTRRGIRPCCEATHKGQKLVILGKYGETYEEFYSRFPIVFYLPQTEGS